MNVAFVARLLAVQPSRTRTFYVGFFASIGTSALAGAIVHGFFPEHTLVGKLLWRVTMLSLGVTSVSALLISAHLIVPNRAGEFWALPIIAFSIYTMVVLFVRWDFSIALLFYLPSALLMLGGFLLLSKQKPMLGWVGVCGLILTLVSAYIQHAKLAIHPSVFDHNATYHVVQMFGLLLIYLAAKQLLTEVDGGSPCSSPPPPSFLYQSS